MQRLEQLSPGTDADEPAEKAGSSAHRKRAVLRKANETVILGFEDFFPSMKDRMRVVHTLHIATDGTPEIQASSPPPVAAWAFNEAEMKARVKELP